MTFLDKKQFKFRKFFKLNEARESSPKEKSSNDYASYRYERPRSGINNDPNNSEYYYPEIYDTDETPKKTKAEMGNKNEGWVSRIGNWVKEGFNAGFGKDRKLKSIDAAKAPKANPEKIAKSKNNLENQVAKNPSIVAKILNFIKNNKVGLGVGAVAGFATGGLGFVPLSAAIFGGAQHAAVHIAKGLKQEESKRDIKNISNEEILALSNEISSQVTADKLLDFETTEPEILSIAVNDIVNTAIKLQNIKLNSTQTLFLSKSVEKAIIEHYKSPEEERGNLASEIKDASISAIKDIRTAGTEEFGQDEVPQNLKDAVKIGEDISKRALKEYKIGGKNVVLNTAFVVISESKLGKNIFDGSVEALNITLEALKDAGISDDKLAKIQANPATIYSARSIKSDDGFSVMRYDLNLDNLSKVLGVEVSVPAKEEQRTADKDIDTISKVVDRDKKVENQAQASLNQDLSNPAENSASEQKGSVELGKFNNEVTPKYDTRKYAVDGQSIEVSHVVTKISYRDREFRLALEGAIGKEKHTLYLKTYATLITAINILNQFASNLTSAHKNLILGFLEPIKDVLGNEKLKDISQKLDKNELQEAGDVLNRSITDIQSSTGYTQAYLRLSSQSNETAETVAEPLADPTPNNNAVIIEKPAQNERLNFANQINTGLIKASEMTDQAEYQKIVTDIFSQIDGEIKNLAKSEHVLTFSLSNIQQVKNLFPDNIKLELEAAIKRNDQEDIKKILTFNKVEIQKHQEQFYPQLDQLTAIAISDKARTMLPYVQIVVQKLAEIINTKGIDQESYTMAIKKNLKAAGLTDEEVMQGVAVCDKIQGYTVSLGDLSDEIKQQITQDQQTYTKVTDQKTKDTLIKISEKYIELSNLITQTTQA